MEPIWLLAHCILGKFLGVVCHCFLPPLDVPTFAATCHCVRSDARDPSCWRCNCGRERCPVVILPKFRLPHKFRDLLHALNLRHGTDGFTSTPMEGVQRIFSASASAGFEPANLGTKGQHATSRPPKPLRLISHEWNFTERWRLVTKRKRDVRVNRPLTLPEKFWLNPKYQFLSVLLFVGWNINFLILCTFCKSLITCF